MVRRPARTQPKRPQAERPQTPRLMRLLFGPLATRPRLLGAVGLGLLTGAALAFIPNDLRASTRFILAWDMACCCMIVADLWAMAGVDEAEMRARAADQDEGQHVIIGLCLAAAAASLGAIGAELSEAEQAQGLMKVGQIALGLFTIAVSWLFVQLVFALHYAHEYYGDADEQPGGPVVGGLAFPGKDMPDYWDFLHFSVIIGVANQTADIAFTSKHLRRTGTLHGVTAFLFNTVILAFSINLAAGLL